LNNSELIVRTLTGIFIVGITLAAVIFSPYTYLLWLGLITFFGTREYLQLESSAFTPAQSILIPFILTLIIGGAGYIMIQNLETILLIAIVPSIMACIIISQFLKSQTPPELVQKGKAYFSAAIYIGLPMLSGCLFLTPDYTFYYVLVPILLIWINDIGAYLIGSKWGTRKIMPLISPGKSLQGTLGGAAITLLLSYILMRLWPELPKGYVLTLGLVTPLFALGGDLWESALKRNAGVKDSGRIFPGHGGVLDRYDSLLFVMPVAALAYFIFVI